MMKMTSFLVECNRSHFVFNKSSMRSVLYFLLVPCLVYKHEYPRTPRVRWGKVVHHCWWLTVGYFLVSLLCSKWLASLTIDPMTIELDQLATSLLAIFITAASLEPMIWFFFFEHFCGLFGELLRFPLLKTFGDPVELISGRSVLRAVNINVSKCLSKYVLNSASNTCGLRLWAIPLAISVSYIFHEICVLYIFDIFMLALMLGNCITVPVFIIYISRTKSCQVLAGVIGWFIFLCGLSCYILEIFARHYSAMPGLRDYSRFRFIPLCSTQLYLNFFNSSG